MRRRQHPREIYLTKLAFSLVFLECGFFRDSELLSASMGVLQNLKPGQTGYTQVVAYNADGANRTECRVSNVMR